jgi:hypothetical protein
MGVKGNAKIAEQLPGEVRRMGAGCQRKTIRAFEKLI